MPERTVRDAPRRRIRVLLSTLPPHGDGTDNPFLALMTGSLPDDVEVEYMSVRRYLTGDFDVLHVHWPEHLLRAATAPRRAIMSVLFLALLARTRLRGRRVVRTVHNTAPHEPGSRVEAALLRLLDRRTDHWIYLNPVPPDQHAGGRRPAAGSSVVLHGHYRDWFAAGPRSAAVPGRLLCFGQLRRYKGAEALLESFADLTHGDPTHSDPTHGDPTHSDPTHGDPTHGDPTHSNLVRRDLSLVIAGMPSDAELHRRLTELGARAEADLRLRLLPDDELCELIGECELVVLPYAQMYNSGALLLALSLNRPAIVPLTPTTAALAAEVGPGWITTYSGPLSAAALAGAVDAARGAHRAAPPDLSRRDWTRLGEQLADIYGAGQLAGSRS